MSYQQDRFYEIAEAIRGVTRTYYPIRPLDFAEKIYEVYDTGESDGRAFQYHEFWDNFQDYGNRTRYDMAFAYWAGEYIRPKYKIAPTGVFNDTSYGCYRFMMNSNVKIVEKEYFDLSNLGLPTNHATAGWRQTFQSCANLEIIEDIGMQAATYYYTFNGCLKLHTIEVLRFEEGTKETEAFVTCRALENINNIEGTIGQNLSFKSSPLSVKSVMNVLTHLKNFSGSSTTRTLTLSTTSKNLMAAQGEIAELDGKTYEVYITDKGWNLE